MGTHGIADRYLLNGINPQAFLEHVLDKILNGHMQDEIKSLLPWNFKPNGSKYS